MVSEVGLYKIKFKGGFHLLRIAVQGGKKVFKIDHGIFEPMERLHNTEEYLEVITRINERTISKDDVFRAKITISWEDRDGRGFNMTVRDLWTLRGILQELPFLQIPLNYTPRKR